MSNMFDFECTTLGVEEILAQQMDRLILEAQNARDFWKMSVDQHKGRLDHAEKRFVDCEARLEKLRQSGFIIGPFGSGVPSSADKIRAMSGEGRQSGRTGKQMLSAAKYAIYAWPTDDLAYPKALAKALGRADLLIRGPDFLRHLGGAQVIVRDHAWSDGSFDVV